MKKRTKAKTSRKFATAKSELPDLVTIMTKLVERLETLERKTDQAISRIVALPTEVRRAVQDLQQPQASYSAQPAPRPRRRHRGGRRAPASAAWPPAVSSRP